jgi:hypothetical protein
MEKFTGSFLRFLCTPTAYNPVLTHHILLNLLPPNVPIWEHEL